MAEGFNLWWIGHDRLEGRVWLGERELQALLQEMLAQGMAWEESGPVGSGIPAGKLATRGARVTPREIVGALDFASDEPRTLDDPKLWREWLVFLEGAARHGGLRLI